MDLDQPIAIAHKTLHPRKELLALLPKCKTYSIHHAATIQGETWRVTRPKVDALQKFGVTLCNWERINNMELVGVLK